MNHKNKKRRRISAVPTSQATAIFEDLNRFPDDSNYLYHFHVDFVELLCLTDADGRMSKLDVLDEQGQTMESEEPPIYDQSDGQLFDPNAEPVDHGRQAQNLVKKEAEVDNWYVHLNYRKQAFREYYPFTLSSDGNTLVLDKYLTLKQKLYIFLLLCSSLSYIRSRGGYRLNLPLAFERLSAVALKSYLPTNAQIHIFGTSEAGLFSGSFWNKLQALAQNLNATLLASQEDIHGNGDGGLDLVAWIPFEDTNGGMMVVFAQCACTSEWIIKQDQASYESRWKQRIQLRQPSSTITFMPFCFRKMDGTWLNNDHIRSIVIDRERFINLFGSKLNSFKSDASYQIVEQALSYKREVF